MAVVKKLISLDESIAKEMVSISNILGVSQREIVEKALDFYFDYLDGLIAEKISNDIESGKLKVFEAEEIFRELGIDV
ncbi:ribbon-helix-helix domain-containing protein [Desulfurobacterium sp.]